VLVDSETAEPLRLAQSATLDRPLVLGKERAVARAAVSRSWRSPERQTDHRVPQPPPRRFTEPHQFLRFVSMLPAISDPEVLERACEVWFTSQEFLDIPGGDDEEHALMLCNFRKQWASTRTSRSGMILSMDRPRL
jgi:hypothetical protein